MRKIAAVAAAAALVLGLAGCQSAKEMCEEKGGQYVSGGIEMVTTTTYIKAGDIMVPYVMQHPVETHVCKGVG